MEKPKQIIVSACKTELHLIYQDSSHNLSALFLRENSPSVAQKKVISPQIKIHSLRLVGNYALQIVFSDGHDSGLFTWQYLQQLIKKD